MIHLEHAHQLDILAERLMLALQQRQDPFEKATLVVPNRNLQQWLNLQLAKRNSQQIIASIAFENLESLLARHFLPAGCSLLDADTSRMLIIAQLESYLRQDAEIALAPVVAYLRLQSNQDKGVFELAGRMVTLFREYELSRPAMIRTWAQEGWYLGPDHLMERWQRRLWRDLFHEGGQLEQLNHARKARAEKEGRDLPNLMPLNSLTFTTPQSPVGTLHLFGQTYVGRFYQHLLHRLGAHNHIYIYALNPCTQFWEDLITDREAKRLRSKPVEDKLWARGYLEEQQKENPLLRAWGRPGREYFRLLNELAHWNIEPDSHDPTASQASLLLQIQYDTRHRQPLPETPTHPQPDESLQIFGCASPRRETEAIANHIWNLMQRDPSLAFNDIGVIVSDMQNYQGAIENAFKRIQHIPFNLVDGKYGRASRLMEAIAQLLNLSDTNREREHLFRLFYHPNFQARFPHADTEWWADHCQRLAIYTGQDARAWERAETKYFDGDLYSWQQGLTRAHLGLYLHPNSDGTHTLGGETYASFAATPGDREAAGFWLTLTRSLLADLEVMAGARLKPSAWATFTATLCKTYLAPRDSERRDFEAMLARIQKLAALDDAVRDGGEIPFTTFRSFLQRALEQLTAYRGQYLADGVTVSSFLPMRPIPFRVLFICGLDEQRFPAPAQRETLDLRWAGRTVSSGDAIFIREREIGDLNNRERDAYMFLEAVVSAKERLVLSYVNRNEATGDPINPSSVLAQLLQWLPAYTGQQAPLQEHPLKTYSQQYTFADLGPWRSHDFAAATLAAAQQCRTALEPTLAQLHVSAAQLAAALATWPAQTRQVFGLEEQTFEKSQPPQERTLNLSSLRKFLESPLQTAVTVHLSMRQRQEDVIFHSEPPLKVDNLTRWSFLTEHFSQSFHEADLEEARLFSELEREMDLRILRGQLPAGPLSSRELQKLQQVLHHWVQASIQLHLTWPPQRATWRLAANDTQALISQPLELATQQRLFLVGPSLPQFNAGTAPVTVHFKTGKCKDLSKQIFSFGLLNGALDACIRSAFAHSPPQRIACVFADGAVSHAGWQMTATDARKYLTHLAQDWQRYNTPYLLPGDFVFQTWQQDRDCQHWADLIVAKIQSQKESTQPSILDQYGPLANWRDFDPPADLPELLQRRFMPLMRAMQPLSKGDV